MILFEWNPIFRDLHPYSPNQSITPYFVGSLGTGDDPPPKGGGDGLIGWDCKAKPILILVYEQRE